MSASPEQDARGLIDAALNQAGWVLQDRAAMNLAAGTRARRRWRGRMRTPRRSCPVDGGGWPRVARIEEIGEEALFPLLLRVVAAVGVVGVVAAAVIGGCTRGHGFFDQRTHPLRGRSSTGMAATLARATWTGQGFLA
jgi:hypothetical protein